MEYTRQRILTEIWDAANEVLEFREEVKHAKARLAVHIRDAHASGYTIREIAEHAHMSHQRVHQILHED